MNALARAVVLGCGAAILPVLGSPTVDGASSDTLKRPALERNATRTRVNLGDGLRVSYPARWHLTTQKLTSVASPVQRLAVASFPLRQRRPDPGCTPTTALRETPASGAWLFLIEYTGRSRQAISSFPPRPARFRLRRGSRGHYECARDSYLVRFQDAGREFQAQIHIGAKAGRRVRAEVLSVLDSLRVSR